MAVTKCCLCVCLFAVVTFYRKFVVLPDLAVHKLLYTLMSPGREIIFHNTVLVRQDYVLHNDTWTVTDIT